MVRVTIADPAVQAILAEGYVFREVDADEEPDVKRAFEVSGVPDTRILRPDGTPVDRLLGFEPPEAFAERLRKARRQ